MRVIIAVLFSLALFLPLSAVKASDEKVLDIEVVKSASGEIEAWFVRDESVPVISISFFFEAQGAWYDMQTQGITFFLSSMLDEGAGEYDSQAFQKMLEDYNLSLSFSGGRDTFGGSLYMISKYQDKGFEALKLALTAARFDEEPLERMRRQLITSAKRRLGDPDWMAARIVNHVAFPDHFYALSSGGTISNLERFTADDLRQFTKDNFTKGNLKVAVAGDISAEELAIKLDYIFGKLPNAPKQYEAYEGSAFPGASIVSKEVDIPQTMVRFVWPSLARDDPDYPAFQVMNYIFGAGGFSSRLMADIREERGLTYGINSSDLNFEKADRLVISASTTHDNIPEMRERILFQAHKMASEPVTDEELNRAKNYLTGSLVLAFTSTRSIGSGVMGLLYDKRSIDYLDGYKERILAVSKEDIQRVAKRLFENTDPIEVYVGAKLERDGLVIIDSIPNAE